MKLPAFQFYPGDWRKDPGVQSLTYHDRGVWHEILCLMSESEQRGKLLLNGAKMPQEALARLLGLDNQTLTTTLTTLLTSGVASIDPDTGAIVNRRMVRDEIIRKTRTECGKLGGNPHLVNQKSTTKVNQKSTPSSSTSSSTSVEEVQPNNTAFRFPSLLEAQTEAEMRGYDKEEAERFWNHFESSGWIDKNTNPIKNWRAKLAIWCADAKSKEAEKVHHSGNGRYSNGEKPRGKSIHEQDADRLMRQLKDI